MIQHLGRQAALIIEDQRRASDRAHHAPDQRALVQVRVNDVGLQPPRRAQRRPRQQRIKRHLVPRRADFVVGVPRRGPRADDIQFRQIAPFVVRHNRDAMPALLQHAHLFQDTHVTAVIPEERRGGDHQNVVSHRAMTMTKLSTT